MRHFASRATAATANADASSVSGGIGLEAIGRYSIPFSIFHWETTTRPSSVAIAMVTLAARRRQVL